MRCFLAVEIPQEQKNSLLAGLRRLRQELPSARWVRPEGLHITLKFLGELREEQALALVKNLQEREAELPQRVKVSLKGGGFFPDMRRARVAWIGGTAPGMAQWVEAASLSAEAFGVPAEARPFALHVTLARLQRPWPETAAHRFLQEVASWELASFETQEIVLFESLLRPDGPVYIAKARVRFGRGE